MNISIRLFLITICLASHSFGQVLQFNENQKTQVAEEIALHEDITNFGPVSDVIKKRSLICRTTHEANNKYKSSQAIGFTEPGWHERLPADYDALNKFAPLERKNSKNPYFIDEGVWVGVYDIKRIANIPHYRFYANHNRHSITFEPWSMAKLLASSAAISKARLISDGRIGANAKVGSYSIGDVITTAFSYSETGNVYASSNEVGNFLLRSATEDYSQKLFSHWLMDPTGSQFFGKFGSSIFNPGTSLWEYGDERVMLPFQYFSGLDNKRMSLLAVAEWMRRLALHRSEPKTRLPHLTTNDVEILFYGDKSTSSLGGASYATSTYVHKALTGLDSLGSYETPLAPENIKAKLIMDRLYGPDWRIFQKNGAGPSSLRNRGESTLVSYVCLPKANKEFIVVARSSLKDTQKCDGSLACYDIVNKSSVNMTNTLRRVIRFILETP